MEVGDVWTRTAIDAESKLIISWLVADRGLESSKLFMEDVGNRLANRVQLTTDGLKKYLVAVDHTFGHQIDFAQLVRCIQIDRRISGPPKKWLIIAMQ
jgi:transposase-like protein